MSTVTKRTIGKALVHLLAVLIILAPMFAVSPVEAADETVLVARLTGAKEVPGPGAPFGRGRARVVISRYHLCYAIRVTHITLPATAAHIHLGTADVAGPIVVPLSAPDANGFARGCAAADADLRAAIANNPGNYYVNVHTSDFPAGAVRGQLELR